MTADPRGQPSEAPYVLGPLVQLVVGPKAYSVSVHESVLRPRSAFFDAALNKCWKEGREKKVTLPEEELRIVTLYVQQLYTGKIHVKKTTTREGLGRSDNLPEFLVLAELYLFGERVQDSIFKDTVTNAFAARILEPLGPDYSFPVTSALDILYKGTHDSSPIRRFMVDMYVRFGCEWWITCSPDDHNKDFLVEVSRALLKGRRTGVVWCSSSGKSMPKLVDFDMSVYHEKKDVK
ncbi:hypothetical protein LTR97_006237 [Elasticomyces elasticus]|uniref:BTB domain-containing protein n=1 Tax=Elasticomyces elasticus TaxID=574655 RepID=A0AAN7ZU51_9PEZI|nr:hypothetical protein LTR97_006237 [Elasticomyces elasticus]